MQKEFNTLFQKLNEEFEKLPSQQEQHTGREGSNAKKSYSKLQKMLKTLLNPNASGWNQAQETPHG